MSILKFNEMKSHKLDIGEDKPVLKYTVKTIYKVEYHDLEAFVKKIYNMRNYEFVANQECSNDSSHEFNINGILGKWELAESEKLEMVDYPVPIDLFYKLYVLMDTLNQEHILLMFAGN